jgi:hypothetical protein
VSKAKFQAAKELIDEGRYDEARSLLRTLDHPTASAWLEKLDRLYPSQPAKRRTGLIVLIAALLVLVVSIGILVLFQSRQGLQAAEQQPEITATQFIEATELAIAQAETQAFFNRAATQRVEMATIMAASPTATLTPTFEPTLTPVPPTIPPSSTPVPEPTALQGGKWEVVTDTSAIDDSTTVTLGLYASEPVQTWLDEEYPILALRCEKGELDVFIATGSQLEMGYGDEFMYHRIRIRYDQESIETREMSESTNGEALFFSSPNLEIELLLRHQQLIVAYFPYNAGEAEAIFDLTGLQDVIQPLRDACPV